MIAPFTTIKTGIKGIQGHSRASNFFLMFSGLHARKAGRFDQVAFPQQTPPADVELVLLAGPQPWLPKAGSLG